MYVTTGGLGMDIDRDVTATVALDGNKNKVVQFTLASGMNGSALEHGVPEQIFSTPENPIQGISAVKALKIANDQGIPIYTINQTNINTILPQLQISGDVKTDIVNAVNAGREVTVSKTNITYNGWTGCGYIIINPATGAGAYMISDGSSGGWYGVLLVGIGVLLIIIGTMTSEIGVGLLLVTLGIWYIGLGFCYIYENPLYFTLAVRITMMMWVAIVGVADKSIANILRVIFASLMVYLIKDPHQPCKT